MSARVSVRRASKEYRECSLEILEERLVIRISCAERRRLRKPQMISFEESLWGLSSRSGSEVFIGDTAIQFPSEEEACSFVKKAISASYARALDRVSSTLLGYLRRRSEVLMTLKNLSTSPRSTLISMASQLMDCGTDPFDCAVEKLKKENIDLYKRFLEEVSGALSTAPKDLADSALNMARMVGALQARILGNVGDEALRALESIEKELGYSIDRARIERLQISPNAAELNKLIEEIVGIWINRVISTISNKFLC